MNLQIGVVETQILSADSANDYADAAEANETYNKSYLETVDAKSLKPSDASTSTNDEAQQVTSGNALETRTEQLLADIGIDISKPLPARPTRTFDESRKLSGLMKDIQDNRDAIAITFAGRKLVTAPEVHHALSLLGLVAKRGYSNYVGDKLGKNGWDLPSRKIRGKTYYHLGGIDVSAEERTAKQAALSSENPELLRRAVLVGAINIPPPTRLAPGELPEGVY